jgi:hypothetical protein
LHRFRPAGERGHAGKLAHSLSQFYDRADARIGRQIGIQLRLITMMQNVQHGSAAHSLPIVEARLIEPTGVEVLDPRVGERRAISALVPKLMQWGRQAFECRYPSDSHPVRAQHRERVLSAVRLSLGRATTHADVKTATTNWPTPGGAFAQPR